MSDFTAWSIAALFASVFAPWYIVAALALGVAWLAFMELP